MLTQEIFKFLFKNVQMSPCVYAVQVDTVVFTKGSQFVTLPFKGDVESISSVQRLFVMCDPLAIAWRIPVVDINAFEFEIICISVRRSPFFEAWIGIIPFFTYLDVATSVPFVRWMICIVTPAFHTSPNAIQPGSSITVDVVHLHLLSKHSLVCCRVVRQKRSWFHIFRA